MAIQSLGETGKNVDTKTHSGIGLKQPLEVSLKNLHLKKKKNWSLPIIPTQPKFEGHISRKNHGRKKWARDGENAMGKGSIRKSCFYRAQFPKVALFNTF